VPGSRLSNADVGELLWHARGDADGHRRRALERASRAARFWPEEVHDLAVAGRSLTELRGVGPWVAARIHGWLDDPPDVPGPDETRRWFLTLAEVRRVLDAHPSWESTPCADLQVHTTFSDGRLRLEEVVPLARSLGRSFIAITDHSETLKIANGMTPAELADQGRMIGSINQGLEARGDSFRVLRAIEVDAFPDGTLDMDEASLASLDLVLGAFHSKLRLTEDQTDRYLATLRQPRLHIPRPGCTGGGWASSPTGAVCSRRQPAWARRSSSTRPRRVRT
jgi:hypothetical protein